MRLLRSESARSRVHVGNVELVQGTEAVSDVMAS